MASAYTKTCPECGAENDGNDLFCKDCGASLAMVNSGSQHTAAFTPVTNGAETQTTTIAPAAAPPVFSYPQTQDSQPVAQAYAAESYLPPQESARGAILGWLSAVLILLVVALFFWSTLITDATRDRITGIF